MKMEIHKEEKRVNDTLTRKLEQKALYAMADRLPYKITPDHLTLAGIFGSVLILAGYILSNLHPAFLFLASFGFIINWFGDSLDGTVARRRKIQRPTYGFYVDHNIDAVSFLMVGLGLGFSPFMMMGTALYTVIGYFMLAIYSYINAYISKEFRISFGKIGPTEVRILVILANTIMFFLGGRGSFLLFGIQWKILDVAGLIVGSLFLMEFFIVFLKERIGVSRFDPAPEPPEPQVKRRRQRRHFPAIFSRFRYRDE
ncbi:MAG: CDP-alcohol phosphatidyltransferase family protein [Spirochaetia bacterium]